MPCRCLSYKLWLLGTHEANFQEIGEMEYSLYWPHQAINNIIITNFDPHMKDWWIRSSPNDRVIRKEGFKTRFYSHQSGWWWRNVCFHWIEMKVQWRLASRNQIELLLFIVIVIIMLFIMRYSTLMPWWSAKISIP